MTVLTESEWKRLILSMLVGEPNGLAIDELVSRAKMRQAAAEVDFPSYKNEVHDRRRRFRGMHGEFSSALVCLHAEGIIEITADEGGMLRYRIDPIQALFISASRSGKFGD